jgi:hypothetical protein
VNALQLVRVLAALCIESGPAPGEVTVFWNQAAAGSTLEGSPALGSMELWLPVNGVADPLTGAGSAQISTADGVRFFRVR